MRRVGWVAPGAKLIGLKLSGPRNSTLGCYTNSAFISRLSSLPISL